MPNRFFVDRRAFAPEGAGGGAGEGEGGTGEGAGAQSGGAGGGEGTGGAPAADWWKGQGYSDDDRDYLTKQGLTLDDPHKVLPKIIGFHRNAEKRLGQPADQLMSKPKKDQPIGDWLRENGSVFGVPESPEKYDIKRPELAEGVNWDEGFETNARAVAHKHGLTPAAMQDFTNLYGAQIGKMLGDAQTELETANTAMMADLEKDWGDQTPARIAKAKQAADFIATQAGLDGDAMQNLAMAFKPKVGDAGTIKLFAAIGEMIGEDKLPAPGGGSSSFTTTPAEARARLAQMRSPGGEFYEAASKGNSARIRELRPEIERLEKIANPG